MKKFMFVVFVALFVLALNTASAQVPSGLIHFTANVTQAALEVAPGDLTFDALGVGKCYKAPADPFGANTITPQTNGEAVTITETGITGDAGTSVAVQFALPTRLYPTGGGAAGYVDLTYDNLSCAWGAPGAETNFFNPNNPITITLDGTGAAGIVLSANPCVAASAGPDAYEGDAIIVIQYAGL
jgi:hypothetical protein